MEQNKARYGAILGRSRCAEFAVVEASAAACGYVVARARALRPTKERLWDDMSGCMRGTSGRFWFASMRCIAAAVAVF